MGLVRRVALRAHSLAVCIETATTHVCCTFDMFPAPRWKRKTTRKQGSTDSTMGPTWLRRGIALRRPLLSLVLLAHGRHARP